MIPGFTVVLFWLHILHYTLQSPTVESSVVCVNVVKCNLSRATFTVLIISAGSWTTSLGLAQVQLINLMMQESNNDAF